MKRAFRIVALLLLAGYAVAATSICPPERPSQAHAQAMDMHSHGGHDAAEAVAAGEHAPCHEEASPLALRAQCPCGCSDRVAPAGAPMGLGPALVSRAGLPVPNPGTDALVAPVPALPAPLSTVIDHVPLAA